MRHLYIVLSYPLSEPVVRNRFMPWLQSCLAERASDIEITLISPPNAAQANVELPQQVRYVEIPCADVQGVPFARRAWREWRNTGRLYRALKTRLRADAHGSAPVVLVSVPSMFLLFLLPGLAQLQRSVHGTAERLTLALDIRDLTWEYLPGKGPLGLIKRLLQYRAVEKIKQPHWVSTTNQQELAYVRNLRGPAKADSCLWVTNGISRAQFEVLRNLPGPVSGADKRQSDKRTQVLYLGNIGVAEHLSSLIEAAALQPQMDFTLVGSGGDAGRLQRLVNQLGLSNVKLSGRCRWEEVEAYYTAADILFAQVHPDHQQQMPSKLYEYLATGRPLVFAGSGYALEVLKPFVGVYCCPPLKVEAISEALTQAQAHLSEHDDSQQAEARALNLARLEAHYIREQGIERWLEHVL